LDERTQNELKSYKERAENDKKQILAKQDTIQNDQAKTINALVATQEMLLEFKNTRLVKKQQIENE
jgi:hypothetical protein